jgi:hypothetical protein
MRDTSQKAYSLIFPNLGKLQLKCYRYIEAFPDKTDNEYAKIASMPDPVTFRRRRSELEDKGVIYRSGKRVCTVTHNECGTWQITKR